MYSYAGLANYVVAVNSPDTYWIEFLLPQHYARIFTVRATADVDLLRLDYSRNDRYRLNNNSQYLIINSTITDRIKNSFN